MSGALGLNLVPINTNKVPPTGAKSAIFNVPWSTTNPFGTYKINLQQQDASGQFEFVQSVYVDNSTCPYQVTLTCDQTGQSIIIKPLSQGYYPLIATVSPSFTAVLNYVIDQGAISVGYSPGYISGCTTRFYFINALMQQQINTLTGYGNNFSNYSTTLSAGTTGNPQTLLPYAGLNTNYLISSFSISALFVQAAASAGYCNFILDEFPDSLTAPSSINKIFATIPYSSDAVGFGLQTFEFPFPILSFFSNPELRVTLINTPGNKGATLYCNINYGTVLIQ